MGRWTFSSNDLVFYHMLYSINDIRFELYSGQSGATATCYISILARLPHLILVWFDNGTFTAMMIKINPDFEVAYQAIFTVKCTRCPCPYLR